MTDFSSLNTSLLQFLKASSPDESNEGGGQAICDLSRCATEYIQHAAAITTVQSERARSNLVTVNVGGTIFTTKRTTFTTNVCKGTYFERLVADTSEASDAERDKDGNVFIDRDPRHFERILNWLREAAAAGHHAPLDDTDDERITQSFLKELKHYNIPIRAILQDLL